MDIKSDPVTDPGELSARLRQLARESDLCLARFIQVLGEFDATEGWRNAGARDCIRWMCSELGLCRSLAYERLRVARALRKLPTLQRLFGTGELSWSKVRTLTRVADADDEQALAVMALKNDANGVQRVCREYRWGKARESAADQAALDRWQFEQRSLTWTRCGDGAIEFRAVLPPDMAANFVRCLEHCEEKLWPSEQDSESPDDRPTAAQRRADALLMMAEASLNGANENVSSADRFQVVVHVDSDALDESIEGLVRSGNASDQQRCSGSAEEGIFTPNGDSDTGSCEDAKVALPAPLRAAITGFLGSSITPATARRLACDGSLITMIMRNGEPIAVGRKRRVVNSSIRRAVQTRDGGCLFPGCGAQRNLDVHHVTPWSLGGQTTVDELVTLCRHCHTRVHTEGWRIVRRSASSDRDGPVDIDSTDQASLTVKELVEGADARTRAISDKLDECRPVFHFELSESPTQRTGGLCLQDRRLPGSQNPSRSADALWQPPDHAAGSESCVQRSQA